MKCQSSLGTGSTEKEPQQKKATASVTPEWAGRVCGLGCSGVGVDTCAQNHKQMPSGPRVPRRDLFLPRGVAAQVAVGQDQWTVGWLWSVDLSTVYWSLHRETTQAGWPRPGLLSDHCLLHGFAGKLLPIYNKAQGLFARKAKKKTEENQKEPHFQSMPFLIK